MIHEKAEVRRRETASLMSLIRWNFRQYPAPNQDFPLNPHVINLLNIFRPKIHLPDTLLGTETMRSDMIPVPRA
jgi:hypothetical protein